MNWWVTDTNDADRGLRPDRARGAHENEDKKTISLHSMRTVATHALTGDFYTSLKDRGDYLPASRLLYRVP